MWKCTYMKSSMAIKSRAAHGMLGEAWDRHVYGVRWRQDKMKEANKCFRIRADFINVRRVVC